MNTIIGYIKEDILKLIDEISFNVEEIPIKHMAAGTDYRCRVIMYNPETVTLFELAEEYFHAKDSHTRKNIGYDIRNSDERDAHDSAFRFLINRWSYYGGPENWLSFIELTGTPHYFEYKIVEQFKNDEYSSSTYARFV
ncbi:hypothetical protein [Weissella tructae]